MQATNGFLSLQAQLKGFYRITCKTSFDEILSALKKEKTSLKPRVIIFNTVKGKGVKAFEGDPIWHARKIKGIEMEIGKKELGLT